MIQAFMATRADELTKLWMSGQRKAVVTEILDMPKNEAILFTGYVVHYLQGETNGGWEAGVFLRVLEDMQD